MNSSAIAVLVIAGIAVLFIIYKVLSSNKVIRQIARERYVRVQILYDKLEMGIALVETDVHNFAKALSTREITYKLLSDFNTTEIFPKEFYSIEKGVAGNLANWLEFPTELNACPDEMEHVKRVTFDFDGRNNLVHYEVFKYRIDEPHWAAKDGWMLGVVGPFYDDSKPYDFPNSTFSRIRRTVDQASPEDEAKWVQKKKKKMSLNRFIFR